MVAVARSGGQLHGHGSAPVSDGSAVGRWNPGDSAKTDALISELARLLLAGLTVDAVRIDIAVMNAAGLVGEAAADIVTISLDLPAHLAQRRTELCGRDRRKIVPRAADPRRHHRLFDRGIAAFG